MKRSFTFTLSRKVSTAPYENADVFVAEGVEVDDTADNLGAFEKDKAEIVGRVRRLVDALADNLRGA
jgi:U3 small nucleolar ribonucleoprotein component